MHPKDKAISQILEKNEVYKIERREWICEEIRQNAKCES